MATTIITKFGVSPATPPLPSELAVGELACNHEDKKLYTKKADGTVIELIGSGGGDPGVLPPGVDGDMLYHNATEWAVAPNLKLKDNPNKPGQKELQLLNGIQLSQYTDDGTSLGVELIGDTNQDVGIRCTQSTGNFGVQMYTDQATNISEVILQKPGSTQPGVTITSGGNDLSIIQIDGPVVSTGGTSAFAGITMSGTNAGINMQNLHRVFNHPDPSTADSTNVANARWVTNNHVRLTNNQTIAGTKTFTGLIKPNTLSVGSTGSNPNGTTYSAVFQHTIAIESVPSATGTTAVFNFGFLGALSSDISLKQDIVPTRLSGLDTVMSGEVVDFKWKSSGESDVGFIAQQMREFVPEAFPTNPDGKLGVRELPLLAALWKAVQELNNKVEALSK